MPKIVRHSTLPGIKSKKQRKKEIDRLTWSEIKSFLIGRTQKSRPDMAPWLQEFLNNEMVTEKGMNTEAAIRKVFLLDTQESNWLVLEVLENCFHASKYKSKGSDPHSLQRRKIRDYMACRGQIAKSLKRIRRNLKVYSDESQWDFLYAKILMRSSQPLSFENVLECLEAAFSQPDVLGLNAGPMLHRWAAGPLLYPAPIDRRKAQSHAALNGLIFNLAFLFRRSSMGYQGKPVMSGEPMPSGGSPAIPLITHFARVTFDDDKITSINVQKRLDSLMEMQNKEASSTIGLIAWPTK